jgi:RpiB/LacA/LacB family sugar-phosphate isomerase
VKVGFACDHAGLPLREAVTAAIRGRGHELVDLGVFTPDPVDYPDIAEALGRAVQSGRVDRGVLVCGSGVGAAVAANKLHGVRAGQCHDCYSAHQAVEHDNANVLALGARVIGPALAIELVQTFLAAAFSGEDRHLRRLAKVAALEQKEARRPPE